MEEANLDALCDLLNDDDEDDLPVEPHPAQDNQVNTKLGKYSNHQNTEHLNTGFI